jgi:proteasome lid subunit RPN8/RPN11
MDRFEQLIDDMGSHAHKDYPLEVCGIITKDFKYIPCKNISPSKQNSFIVDPLALLEHEESIWGIFHSHPGDDHPIPSEQDMKHTMFDEFKFVVGFANKFFIYWFDDNLNMLRYEPFESYHIESNS